MAQGHVPGFECGSSVVPERRYAPVAGGEQTVSLDALLELALTKQPLGVRPTSQHFLVRVRGRHREHHAQIAPLSRPNPAMM